MSPKKIVVALGGNALGNTPYEQLSLVKQTAKPIADLIEAGNDVVITHGNGPQVGMINLGFTKAFETGTIKSDMPLPECGAMSQGYIGYQLQNAIINELNSRKIAKSVVSVTTRVLVNKDDKAFLCPTKPIGAFYSEEEAEKLSFEKGYCMKEDSGRGYRRVVPSPKPVDILEKDVVKALVDSGFIVIASGGGGVPVICEKGEIKGIDAVIDKDFSARLLGELIDADVLLILTSVDGVCIDYNKPSQKLLKEINCQKAQELIEQGQFSTGSMLPKVLACVEFVKGRQNRKAVIGSLEKALDAINGESGTAIIN